MLDAVLESEARTLRPAYAACPTESDAQDVAEGCLDQEGPDAVPFQAGEHEVHTLATEALLAGDSPRLNGEESSHVQLLATSDAPLPPILVHRATMRVIDGMHRLRAAQLRGQRSINVRFFDGNNDEAFIIAVKANTDHGLPLTLADREAAAIRIIAANPYRSDRWIAAITGLAARTVATIRERVGDDGCEVTARIGRDGRVRPLNAADGRRIAGKVIAEHPEASLREIAKVAGISPATVRDVRERMRRGDDPVPPKRYRRNQDGERIAGQSLPRGHPRVSRDRPRERASLLLSLEKDPSLRHTQSGRALLKWLHARAMGPGGWQERLTGAPPHVSYLIAELARSCAEEWLEFAAQLEEQVRSMA